MYHIFPMSFGVEMSITGMHENRERCKKVGKEYKTVK